MKSSFLKKSQQKIGENRFCSCLISAQIITKDFKQQANKKQKYKS